MKRTPLRRKSKSPNAKIVAAADALWAKIVKDRASGLCEKCGKPGSDAHHMVSRRYRYLRHELANGVYLCKGCHLNFHSKESLSLWAWMQVNRPKDFNFINDFVNEPFPKGKGADDYAKLVEIANAMD